MRRLDHLIVSAPSLEAGVSWVEERLGMRPAFGGRHEGRGTQNALLALGERCYLEVLAPDPGQSVSWDQRFLKLDDQTPIRVATWVAQATDLDQVARRARELGIELGEPRAGERLRSDGTRLAWRMLGPDASRMDGLIPFFIDWGASPHPSSSMAHGCELRALRAEHQDPAPVRAALTGLDLELKVEPGAAPGLIATIECPRGVVELRERRT